METITSSSTMDCSSRIKTAIVLGILYGVCLIPLSQGSLGSLAGMFFFSTALCVVMRGLVPNRFVLDSEALRIDSYFQKITIPVGEIASVRQLEKRDFGSMLRTFGGSGLFGDIGYFQSATIGSMKVFARRSDNWILVSTYTRGNYTIAPDDTQFIDSLQRMLLRR